MTENNVRTRPASNPSQRLRSFVVVAALAAGSIAASFAFKTPGATSHAATGGTPLSFSSVPGRAVYFQGQLSQAAVLQGGDGQVRMKLLLGAGDVRDEMSVRVPTDLLVILDRSGSMEGAKIDYARQAVAELISQLDDQDRFALVSYSSGAELTIPLTHANSDAKSRWTQTARQIRVGGGTNMQSGIDLALGTLGRRDAGRSARILLLSDGLANEGDASYEGLTARAKRAANREYVLSAVGLGDDFNEYLMSGLADAGTGNYYYLENTRELATVFSQEFDATRATVATGVAVTIQPGSGVDVIEAAGYPLERDGDGVTFRPGTLFAGQERSIWVTLQVPSNTVAEHALGTFAVSYTSGGERQSLTLEGAPRVACVEDRERMLASVDKEAWEASVVEDAYHRLEEDVARAVKAGRPEAAASAIAEYRSESLELNRDLKSEVVNQNLATLETLEEEVEDAFTGDDQELKQNKLSKKRQASSWDGRRAGSKKTKP